MSKVEIVAEIGWNHMGDINLAREMINAAKNAGIPVILLEDGYTEKKTNEIRHDHLIKDFIGIEKIISKYL